jgi:hypothetical protein
MRTSPKLRSFLTIAAVSMIGAALFVPYAPAAKKVPPLASTAQYKALDKLVKKLQSQQTQPTTAAQKATYEAELTGKYAAANTKSIALFNQGKKAVSRETQSTFKADSIRIRKNEAREINLVQDEYGNRLDNAADDFQQNQESLEDSYGGKLAKFRKLIADLRVSKAKAKGVARKAQIQGEINTLSQRVRDTIQQRSKARAKLKADYSAEKIEIKTAKLAAIAAVRKDGQNAVEKARSRSQKTYGKKLAGFQKRRAGEVVVLDSKLAAGRGAISLMPVSG